MDWRAVAEGVKRSGSVTAVLDHDLESVRVVEVELPNTRVVKVPAAQSPLAHFLGELPQIEVDPPPEGEVQLEWVIGLAASLKERNKHTLQKASRCLEAFESNVKNRTMITLGQNLEIFLPDDYVCTETE